MGHCVPPQLAGILAESTDDAFLDPFLSGNTSLHPSRLGARARSETSLADRDHPKRGAKELSNVDRSRRARNQVVWLGRRPVRLHHRFFRRATGAALCLRGTPGPSCLVRVLHEHPRLRICQPAGAKHGHRRRDHWSPLPLGSGSPQRDVPRSRLGTQLLQPEHH